MAVRPLVHRIAALRAVASPAALARLLDSALLDPRLAPAAARAAPELLRSGASLGFVSTLNAAAYGARPAVIDRAGTLTWRELDARAAALARAFTGMGLGPGATVATLLRNGREQVEGIVAAQKAGMVAAPLNTWSRGAELRVALERAAPDLLIYDGLHADQVRRAAPDGIALVAAGDPGGAVVGSRRYEDLLANPGAVGRMRGAGPLAPRRIVIHTSGTTGRPKGASRATGAAELGPILGLLTLVPYRRGEVVFCPVPLFHAFGVLTLSVTMLLGGTLVLPERFDPEEAVSWMARTRATAASLVPVMVRRIVSLPDDVLGAHDLSMLRIAVVSGAALGPDLRRRARTVLGDVLYDLYGSTEAGWVAVATPEDMVRRPGATGRPVPGVEVAVLSSEGDPLPPGRTGELHVRSAAAFEGYTSDDHIGGRGGYVGLGDLGHVDRDGYLHVEGRADDMVVVGGENVYPAEVEEVVLRAPGVRDAAVFGVPDEEYGQVLAAFVVGDAEPEAVREACRAELASYKVPHRVEAVDELPRTPSGKVVKRELLGREH